MNVNNNNTGNTGIVVDPYVNASLGFGVNPFTPAVTETSGTKIDSNLANDGDVDMNNGDEDAEDDSDDANMSKGGKGDIDTK